MYWTPGHHANLHCARHKSSKSHGRFLHYYELHYYEPIINNTVTGASQFFGKAAIRWRTPGCHANLHFARQKQQITWQFFTLLWVTLLWAYSKQYSYRKKITDPQLVATSTGNFHFESSWCCTQAVVQKERIIRQTWRTSAAVVANLSC